MVVIDIYGTIPKIELSKKLGLILTNLPEDWQEGIVEAMEEEIRERSLVVEKYQDPNIRNYDLLNAYEGCFKDAFPWGVYPDKDLLVLFARHMVCIETEESETSYLRLKNEYIDSPTWEKDYCEKIITFFTFLIRGIDNGKNQKWYQPIYLQPSASMHIFPIICSDYNRKLKKILTKEEQVKDIEYYGKLLVLFLISPHDFWKLDYIITALTSGEQHNLNYLAKMVQLLEMLVVNTKSNGNLKEFDSKLSRFLPDNLSQGEKLEFCRLIRQLRNKIAHGDFAAINYKLEEYARIFMQDAWFDYYEFSRQNWVIGNICFILDTIVSKIVWLLLTERSEVEKLQAVRI